MSTPRDLISFALRVSGVVGLGQTPSAVDISDGVMMLTMMVSQWQRKRWLSLRLADIAIPLTGLSSYSIGPGGAVNVTRPDRIESAFLRVNPTGYSPQDWPVEIIDNREDWNQVALKSVHGIPGALYYDPSYPLGSITVYPNTYAGNTQYELHISVKDGLSSLVGIGLDIDVDLGVPPEYDAAILYNLAVRMRPAYGLSPDPTITALALDALATIRRANAQIPHLRMPSGLPGMRGNNGSMFPTGGGGGSPPVLRQDQLFAIGFSQLNGPGVLQ